MLVVQFFLRNYTKVFQLSESCVSDTTLSGEEQQLFDHLQVSHGLQLQLLWIVPTAAVS